MRRNWTLTKLIATGSLGVLCLISFIPYMIAKLAFDVVGLTTILASFLLDLFLIPSLLVIDTFGAATLGITVFAILTLPLPLLGPPGFFPKILLGPIYGLPIDLLYLLLRKKQRLAAFVIGIGVTLSQAVGLILLFKLVKFPGGQAIVTFATTQPGISVVMLIMIAQGIIGTILGLYVYNRIKDTAVVQRIQRSSV
jgi:hypothetical protein